MTGSSTQGIKTAVHPVTDLAAAKAAHAALLGVAPQTDSEVATVTDPDGNVLGLLQDR